MTQILTVPVTHIDANPDNPRHDLGDLTELEASIRQVGILQPLVVRPNGTGDSYQLIAGHRRLAAAIRAGLNEVPVTTVEADDRTALAMALIENLQRQDIDPIDEAVAYRKLRDFGWKQNDIAKRISRSPSHISKRIRLLELPETAQEAIRGGDLNIELAYEVAKAAKEHKLDLGAVTDQLLDIGPWDREHELDRIVADAAEQTRLEEKAGELEARGHHRLRPYRYEYGRWVYTSENAVRVNYPGGIYFEDDAAHQTEPCARFLLSLPWAGGRDAEPIVEWYCLAPKRHTPEGESDLKAIERSQKQLQEEEKQKAEEAARRAEKKARAEWIRTLFDSAPGASSIDYDVVVARAWRVLIHRLEVNVAKLACQYLRLEPERKVLRSYSFDDWRRPLEAAIDQDLYRTLLAICLAQGEAHAHSPYVPEDADWVKAHEGFLAGIGYRREQDGQLA